MKLMNFLFFVIIGSILWGCNLRHSDEKLRIKDIYLEFLSDKTSSSDHEIVMCFNQKLLAEHYDMTKNNKFSYKVDLRFYSVKGWSQNLTVTLQRVKVLDHRPNCIKVVNESYYHPFMGYEKVVDENFSLSNLKNFNAKLFKFNSTNQDYDEIQVFEKSEN